jgi:glycosyltransferase involved in cell wall biosynthesis
MTSLRILILVSSYLPAYKAGGPVRTISNMVDQLGKIFDFWILTGDRDYQDSHSFDSVPLRKWLPVGHSQVYYVDPASLSLLSLRALIDEVKPDIVYLNSLFSLLANKYLFVRRMGMIPQIPTIAVPRGTFSSGALQLKRLKKQTYLLAARGSDFYKGLYWQASSKAEKEDIHAILPCVAEEKIFVAPDLVVMAQGNGEVSDWTEIGRQTTKEPGQVHLIYLSRIKPVKNLKFALTLLPSLKGQIKFDLFGPVQDQDYWDDCQEIIKNLPPHIQVQYHGPVPNEEVRKIFSDAQFLLLPTLGESFGHVILESLQAGCPVLISDRTPWDDLSKEMAGWVIPLEENNRWIETIQSCIDMGQESFIMLSNNAAQYAMHWLGSSDALQVNRDMFLSVAAKLVK